MPTPLQLSPHREGLPIAIARSQGLWEATIEQNASITDVSLIWHQNSQINPCALVIVSRVTSALADHWNCDVTGMTQF
eukprot:scaffold7084_cov100-Cylindrotheca_fusiformis.AAC.2